MTRILFTTLTAIVVWAALLASGVDGALRLASTGAAVFERARTTSPIERALLADADDGRLDRMSLVEAALVASGTTDRARIVQYQADVDRFATTMRRRLHVVRGDQARAEELLLALHKQFLSGRYHATQSDIAITLERGDFNCLSSVILYVALGRSVGVDVRPAVLPGHIIAVLPTTEGRKPVETTYAKWFSAVRDGRVHMAAVPATQSAPPYDRSNAVELSDTELIALVYYNQGYEHLTRNQFAAAWSANEKALSLDPDSHRSRGNFLATINNWSLDLCKHGEFAEARRLVAHGLEMAPDYAPLRANNRHVHRVWVDRLIATGRWSAATQVLTEAIRKWPNERFFAHYLQRVKQHRVSNGV